MTDYPLVSAIMPTAGRHAFAVWALIRFEKQSWPNKELIIVDEITQPSFRRPPETPGILYLKEPRVTIGAKRNIACANARGAIIIHWDDDDISEPDRISDQAKRLIETDAEVTGYCSAVFTDGMNCWLYAEHQQYAIGSSLCYWKHVWRARPFGCRDTGEDNEFIAGRKVVGVDARGLLTIRVHAGQTNKTRQIIDEALRRGSRQWRILS